MMSVMHSLVVIIPTLNEAQAIGAAVARIHETGSPLGVIVSDCGSTDGTVREARSAGTDVICDDRADCRAAAMNVGAEAALDRWPEARVLWFVHADSSPPAGWPRQIECALGDARVVGGAFEFRLITAGQPWHGRLRLWLVMLVNRARYRLTGRFFGDQGIFVRRQAFTRAGGFPARPLMEDAALCRRLRRYGRLALVKAPMATSARRFLRHGILRQGVYDLALMGLDRLGLRWRWVARWYNADNAPPAGRAAGPVKAAARREA